MPKDVELSLIMESEPLQAIYLNTEAPEEKAWALRLLRLSSRLGIAKGQYIEAKLLLNGRIGRDEPDAEERALGLLCKAANSGYPPARLKLNAICEERYAALFPPKAPAAPAGVLTDFDGKEIKIDRAGLLTPVDAVLSYENGRSVLTLSANIQLWVLEPVADEARLKEAVMDGIREWAGRYRVFGDQPLEVRVELTQDDRLFDNVIVIPMTKDFKSRITNVAGAVGPKTERSRLRGAIRDGRSMAYGGTLRWSVHSRKLIYLQSDSGKFDEYDEIRAVAKHEFGHVLGLGDLYESAPDHLPGVDQGTYRELDGYSVGEKAYNLVMCDHFGPVSNNDIEMIVLAFRENRAQLYQPDRVRKHISKALGKGN